MGPDDRRVFRLSHVNLMRDVWNSLGSTVIIRDHFSMFLLHCCKCYVNPSHWYDTVEAREKIHLVSLYFSLLNWSVRICLDYLEWIFVCKAATIVCFSNWLINQQSHKQRKATNLTYDKLQQPNSWHFFLINYPKVNCQLSYQNCSLHFSVVDWITSHSTICFSFQFNGHFLQEKNLFKSNKNSNMSWGHMHMFYSVTEIIPNPI